jgi:hypothetical protein
MAGGEGPTPAQWPRSAAVFGAAAAVWLMTRVAVWAFEKGIIGPRLRGQRILMRLPVLGLRLVGGAATVVAVMSGSTLLNDARRRWAAYQEEVRALAPLPRSRPSEAPPAP